MNFMENLKQQIEKMLEGEKKKRVVAERFLNELTNVLEPVAPEFWDKYEHDICAVWVTDKIYFCWESYQFGDSHECKGFHLVNEFHDDIPRWGRDLEEVRGPIFWQSLAKIIEWVSKLPEKLAMEEKSRDRILALLAIEKPYPVE